MRLAKNIFILAFLLVLTYTASAQSISIPDKVTPKVSLETKDTNLEIGTVSPNELEGYKFFTEERLSKLKLGISTKADVQNSFGKKLLYSSNFEIYNYNSKWHIRFNYFGEGSGGYNQDGGNGKIIKFRPSLEFIGKVSSIEFIPLEIISFNEIVFPEVFNKQTVTHFGITGTVSYWYDLYVDKYGLRYKIINKITDSNYQGNAGDLMSIEYTIPHKLRDKILVEQK